MTKKIIGLIAVLVVLIFARLALATGVYRNVYRSAGVVADPTTKFFRGDNTVNVGNQGSGGVAGATGATGNGATGATGATGGTGAAGTTWVWLAPIDLIAGWPTGATGSTDYDVDLSDDGVPDGATAAILTLYASDAATNTLYVGPASRATEAGDIVGKCLSGVAHLHMAIVQVDSSRVIHVKWGSNNTLDTINPAVVGYIK
jgi:hypothetical protein